MRVCVCVCVCAGTCPFPWASARCPPWLGEVGAVTAGFCLVPLLPWSLPVEEWQETDRGQSWKILETKREKKNLNFCSVVCVYDWV